MEATWARYRRALDGRPLPAALVDLDALDENIGRLVAPVRAAGKRLRLASKSLRCPALMRHIAERGGDVFGGVMTYTASETAFLAGDGWSDLLLAYPTVQPSDAKLLAEANRHASAAVVIDAVEHLGAARRRRARGRHAHSRRDRAGHGLAPARPRASRRAPQPAARRRRRGRARRGSRRDRGLNSRPAWATKRRSPACPTIARRARVAEPDEARAQRRVVAASPPLRGGGARSPPPASPPRWSTAAAPAAWPGRAPSRRSPRSLPARASCAVALFDHYFVH